MKIVWGFEDGAWASDNKYVKQRISECRQYHGYQEDTEWECLFIKSGCSDEFRAKHPDMPNGGFICPVCLTMETKEWAARGLPIPVYSPPEDFEEGKKRPLQY